MNIYLRWEHYILKSKENISIFDLEISQEEDCFSKAKLLIEAGSRLPPTGTEATLQEDNQDIIFKGSLCGVPLKLAKNFSLIELIAKPNDFPQQISRLQSESRISPYWDALWVKNEKHNDENEIQGARTASLYCDRRTGKLSWSDWFECGEAFEINHNYFQESLRMKKVRNPLHGCSVKVNAYWVQTEKGVTNLGPAIGKAFPNRKLSTYTKKALTEKWPEAGKRLGRSGIWVIKSELKPVTPSSALYPPYSPPLLLNEEGDQPMSYRLKRHWFKPILWVGWQYQQKRKETLSFSLYQSYQPLVPGEGEIKKLEFTLQNINPEPHLYAWCPETYYREGAKVCYQQSIYKCKRDHTSDLFFEEDKWFFKKVFHTPLGHPARASFFLTERGHKACEHAMERAKLELAKSARSLEVSFEGPWNILKNVTTDMCLTLSDPRLPGGQVKGKIVKYSLIVKGETGERYVNVTLLCSVGVGDVERVEEEIIPSYAFQGYCEEGYQVHKNGIRKTSTGLTYFSYEDQRPAESHNFGSLLRGIELINGPLEQEASMLHYHSPSALKKGLSQKSTRLRLFFKDLRTKERLDHEMTVKMAASWSAPVDVEVKSGLRKKQRI
ncbi:MAG: hypothetical protein K2P93_05565 [Alphaproteobacteria bacterium]|nr:hypothetical protein [Alphaproteobacteria bacterium]